MAAFSNMFDTVVSKHGSGWEAVHVTVERWLQPEKIAGQKTRYRLTLGAMTPQEFDDQVDELIAQLQALKGQGAVLTSRIQAHEARLAEIAKSRPRTR